MQKQPSFWLHFACSRTPEGLFLSSLLPSVFKDLRKTRKGWLPREGRSGGSWWDSETAPCHRGIDKWKGSTGYFEAMLSPLPFLCLFCIHEVVRNRIAQGGIPPLPYQCSASLNSRAKTEPLSCCMAPFSTGDTQAQAEAECLLTCETEPGQM